ncbi:MAG: tripartite tricarboxylate transporter substrate binding protein [Rhizobiales bacterium]|nr:tripartite tricarboxylate transporter substrate binding protein [Hyphomicrobiales bacterium]
MASSASAQTSSESYPTRPVRWVVGFPAGGSSDIVARILSDWLQARLGRPFLVENKPGAGSNIATEAVVNAPPDGYTLGSVTSANAINATLNKSTLSFDLRKQIAPIAGSARGPSIMVVNPSVPVRTVAEFIAYAKANPGKINMGTPGVGTTGHMAGELFKAMTGVDLVHVPYRGSAPALTDLVGGQVQVMFDAMITTLPHIRSGKLRALGVTTATRSEVLSDLPAIAETVPGYEAVIWYGVGAPRGTPADIVSKLNREINAGLASQKIKSQLAQLGSKPIALSPAEFGAFVQSETEKWEKVISLSGTKID